MPRRVTIEEAENGYTIRSSDEKGNDVTMVAVDCDEALVVAKELIGEKPKKKHDMDDEDMVDGMKKRSGK